MEGNRVSTYEEIREQADAKQLADNNAAIGQVAGQLKALGLAARVADKKYSVEKRLEIDFGGKTWLMDTMHSKSSGLSAYSYRRTAVTGFQLRYDHEGKRGMGARRYPLKKDGTIDAARLKDDLESWKQREDSRRSMLDSRLRHQQELASEFVAIKREVDKSDIPSVYIEVENDGHAANRLRFKVSGHVSPARARAIIAAINATKEA